MKSKTITEEAIAGLSAGIVGTVLGYPLDVIKTRMQTNNNNTNIKLTTTIIKNHQYNNNNILTILFNIIQKDGIISLYKGIGPSLISLSILNTMTFSSYSYIQKDILHGNRNQWDIKNGISGCIIGPISSIISTIENLIKTQMQIDQLRNSTTTTTTTTKKQYRNSFDCFNQLLRHRKQQQQYYNPFHSISILYTGHFINTIRESTFLFTYFFMYEGLRNQFIHIGQGIESKTTTSTIVTSHDHVDHHYNYMKWAIPIAGGISGAIAWTVSFPLDLVRANIQGRDMMTSSSKKISSISIMIQLFQQKGIIGLYSGVIPSIIRAFLVSGSRFSAYEGALYLLRGGRDVQYD